MKPVLILTKQKYIDSIKRLSSGYLCEFATSETIPEYEKYNWNLIVSYCYPVKVEGRLLDQNIYNLHPAPLPEFRGADPYKAGGQNRVKSWGVTLHKMTKRFDEGEIVMEKRFLLEKEPTKNELWIISHNYAFNLLDEFLSDFLNI